MVHDKGTKTPSINEAPSSLAVVARSNEIPNIINAERKSAKDTPGEFLVERQPGGGAVETLLQQQQQGVASNLEAIDIAADKSGANAKGNFAAQRPGAQAILLVGTVGGIKGSSSNQSVLQQRPGAQAIPGDGPAGGNKKKRMSVGEAAALYALDNNDKDDVEAPRLQRQQRRSESSQASAGAFRHDGRRASDHTSQAFELDAAVDDEEPPPPLSESLHLMPVANPISGDESNTDHQQAQPVSCEQEAGKEGSSVRDNKKGTLRTIGGVAILIVLIIIVVVIIVAVGSSKDQESNSSSSTHTNTTNPLQSEGHTDTSGLTMEDLQEYVLHLLPEATRRDVLVALDDGVVGFQNLTASTPQQQAYQWTLRDPNITNLSDQRKLQRFALATFFYATSGPTGWRQSDNWLSYEVHECDWFVAEATSPDDSPDIFNLDVLNDTGRSIPCNGETYEFLRLKDNDLDGTLPVELALLANLKGIALEGNAIRGTIPSQLGTLSGLEEILLFAGELTGTIPTQLGLLPQLQLLHLFINELTGALPTELGLLSENLLAFTFSTNSITGPIPSQLGGLAKLESFWAHQNSMSGSLPTEIGRWTNMRVFQTARGGFSGSFPAELWKQMTKLELVWASANQFSGSIPTQIGYLTALQTLDFGGNRFTGTIPTQIGKLTNLAVFKGNKAGPSGRIPSELGLCTSLLTWHFGNNRLSAPIPPQLGNLTLLRELNIFKTDLSGTLPSELGRLQSVERRFRFSDCNLTGTIPSQVGLVRLAHTIDLSNNDLTGSLPTELGNLHGSTLLSLFGNQLSGPIPSQLGLLDSNTELLDLEGKFQKRERNVSRVLLWGNRFTGTVPEEIGALSLLKQLEIYNNTGLTGRIPASLCGLETWPEAGGGIKVDCERVNCTCNRTCECA